jgi:hypothetical protein
MSLFKNSRDVSTAPSTVLVMENLFGSPASVRHIFREDDTGINVEPLPGSRPLAPHNRIYFGIHKTLHTNLAGPGLADLATRFVANLVTEIEKDESIAFGTWTEIPDLYAFVQKKIFRASTSALCGPYLFNLNPTFTEDFWEFDAAAPTLFKAIPRWMAPRAYRVRDRLHTSVKKWHAFAIEKFDWTNENLEEVIWEENFGAKLMRERQKISKLIDGFNENAMAANDLGLIWA